MDRTQDFNASNLNTTLVEDDEKMKYLLTQKLDEVVDGEIKKVGVQKMEDDLTIKMLEREYLETKRNLVYSKQKLEEARKKANTQSETINQLLHANRAIIEKFEELKRFQNTIILMNINNAEKNFADCKNKNHQTSSALQTIVEKEGYSEKLNKEMNTRKSQLNFEIQKQIEENKTKYNVINQESSQLDKNLEILKQQFDQEKRDQLSKNVLEEKRKRLIQLEADEEVFQKQSKQEMDILLNEISKFQNLEMKKKDIEEKQHLITQLKSQISLLENNQTTPSKTLEELQSKKQEILNEVLKKREIDDLSRVAFKENIENIKNEQDKINVELEEAKNSFSKNEEDLRVEFESLYAQVKEKSKIHNKIESSQQELNKLKKIRVEKQKELTNDKERQDQLRESEVQLQKYEQIVIVKTKKQNEVNTKLQNLIGKRDDIKRKLQSLARDLDELKNKSIDSNLNDSAANKKTSQSATPQRKSVTPEVRDIFGDDHESVKNSQKTSQSLTKKSSLFDFHNLDSSDDSSDDDFDIKNLTPMLSLGSASTSQKKPVSNFDWVEKTSDEKKEDRTVNNKLFDDFLSSPKPSETQRGSKEKDLFKVPHTYMTPIRKKTTQTRKY